MSSFAVRLQLTGIALVLFGGLWDLVQVVKPYGSPEFGAVLSVFGLAAVFVGLFGPPFVAGSSSTGEETTEGSAD
ncbi:MAG: hypothetical protein ABEH83_01595 [Halobacterium sp.]